MSGRLATPNFSRLKIGMNGPLPVKTASGVGFLQRFFACSWRILPTSAMPSVLTGDGFFKNLHVIDVTGPGEMERAEVERL